MTAPTLDRNDAPPQELSDADLESKGMLEPGAMEFDLPGGPAVDSLNVTDLDFDRSVTPGDTLFNWPQGQQRGFEATAQGTDPTKVRIYHIDGRPADMRKDWAILRLLKRYPKNHPKFPNQPVFYRRQPRVPAVATIPCPATDGDGCRKMLFTPLQATQHFRSRHKGEWARNEEQRQYDLQERSIKAQEDMAKMFAKFLEAGGTAAQLPTPLAEAVSMGEGPLPFEPDDTIESGNGFDVETADKKALMRYVSESGIAKAAGKNPMLVPIEELRDMVRADLAVEAVA